VKGLSEFKELILAGPAPSPLLKAERYYRYQVMLRTCQMSKLSGALARLLQQLKFPDEVLLTVDIDPVNLL
jgi:primosomal protein N' (replication factor Y)